MISFERIRPSALRLPSRPDLIQAQAASYDRTTRDKDSLREEIPEG
jgi:hypothetical protein